VSAAIPIVQDEITRISAVSAPSDQVANVAKAKAVLAKQVTVAAAVSLAASGDTARIRATIKTNGTLHSDGQKVAKKMGASECAK